MGNGDLFEFIADFGVAQLLVKCHGGRTGMQDHLPTTVLACQHFGVFHQRPADSLLLKIRLDRNLPHPHIAAFEWAKHKASGQSITNITGHMPRILFAIQVFSRQPQAKRFSQDRIPEADRRPVVGRAIRDFTNYGMFAQEKLSGCGQFGPTFL